MDTLDAKNSGKFFVDLNLNYHYHENNDHVVSMVYSRVYISSFLIGPIFHQYHITNVAFSEVFFLALYVSQLKILSYQKKIHTPQKEQYILSHKLTNNCDRKIF